MKSFDTHRLVKSEDLNHHGTLFAGRSAEWFVEAGFIAAASLLPAKNLICLKIHGMTFKKAVKPGNIICLTSKAVFAGKTSLKVFVDVSLIGNEKESLVEGFLTFVHVDDDTKPVAHNLIMTPETEEEKDLAKKAELLNN